MLILISSNKNVCCEKQIKEARKMKKYELKLKKPTYLQIVKHAFENQEFQEQLLQTKTPIVIEPNVTFVFPKGYDLDDLLADSKKLLEDNQGKNALLEPFYAEAKISEAKETDFNRLTHVANALSKRFDSLDAYVFPRSDLIIQSHTYINNSPDLKTKSLRFHNGYVSGTETLESNIYINFEKVREGTELRFKNEIITDIKEIEKFWNETKKMYLKIFAD